MAHQMVLWRDRITELKAANEAVTRRKQRKRKRIQQGGVLTFKAGSQLVAKDCTAITSSSKKSRGKARADGVEPT